MPQNLVKSRSQMACYMDPFPIQHLFYYKLSLQIVQRNLSGRSSYFDCSLIICIRPSLIQLATLKQQLGQIKQMMTKTIFRCNCNLVFK